MVDMVPIKPIGGGIAGEIWKAGNSMRIGIQDQGSSTDPIYRLAERTICSWGLPYTSMVLDLGGGAGHFAETLTNYFEHVHLMDFSPIIHSKRIICSSGNLNELLPYSDATFDAVVSLEVIEHLENPRHLVREIARILKVNGRCLITTPNQISLSSKLCLLLRGQFQHFQDNSYPAHITALLPVDLKRITAEAGLAFKAIGYTDDGRIPGTNIRWQIIPFLTGKWFSDNLAIVAVKV
jgi:SAM-dependent methyltransferase